VLGIPGPGRLPKTVQGLVKAQYLVFVAGDDEAGRLMDVYFFPERPVEEHAFDAHVMDRPACMRRECHQHPHRLQSRHRSKDLVEVDPGALHVPPFASRLVSHDVADFIALDLVNPLQSDCTVPYRERGYLPGVVVFNRLHLVDHSLTS
jgi:hypothetical protein